MSPLAERLRTLTAEQRAAFLDGLDAEDLAVVEEALAELEALAALEHDQARQAREDESLRERHARWRVDPAAFAVEAFRWPEGKELRGPQRRALRALAKDRRLALRSLHGVGKTGTAAFAVLWFACTREWAGDDWKCPTTASAWRQLEKFLWPEIHKWARCLRWDLVGLRPWRKGRELLDMAIKLDHGEAFAAASDDPAKLEGAHADQLLYVFDESKAIPPATFSAAEGAFSNAGTDTRAEAFALMLSTPGPPAGRFYDVCRRAAGTEDWTVQRITVDEAIAECGVSREWVEQRRRDWGEESALFQNRVLGEFFADEADTVIPLAWVEAANDRWHELRGRADCQRRVTHVGVDVARYGVDDTVVISMAGDFVGQPYRPGAGNTQFLASRILPLIGTAKYGPVGVVDADNIGAGLYDELAATPVMGDVGTLAERVHAFRGGMRSDWVDRSGQLRFANLRAAAWWHLRDMLDPRLGSTLALPPDDRLTGDLTAPRWRESAGRILIESKDDLRSRIGRSTDTGDAMVYAAWGRLLGIRAVTNPRTHRGPAGITDDLLTKAM